MTRSSDAPIAEAASTNWVSFTERATDRITLAVLGIRIRAIAAIMVNSPAPSAANINKARMIVGNAMNISKIRWDIRSNFFPKYPVATPQINPKTSPMKMEIIATIRVILAP